MFCIIQHHGLTEHKGQQHLSHDACSAGQDVSFRSMVARTRRPSGDVIDACMTHRSMATNGWISHEGILRVRDLKYTHESIVEHFRKGLSFDRLEEGV